MFSISIKGGNFLSNKFDALKSVRTLDEGMNKKKWWKENLVGYAFILPWLVGFLAFIAYPLLSSVYYSLTEYNIVGDPSWIGLKNYIEIFTGDRKFWLSLRVTTLYVIFAVPLRLTFALGIAMLFRKARPFTNFYRAAFYVPSILGGGVAISVIWRQLFSSQGAFNDIMVGLGFMSERVSWIGHPDYALWTLILLAAWQFGSPMIIFLAGLKQIPKGLYEAAEIDGANKVQKFFKVTLPLLTPVIFFNLIMQMVKMFMMFTQAMVITEGGPLNRTLVYALYMYNQGIKHGHLGYGAALAWVILVLLSIVTVFVFATSDKWVYYESGGKN